MAPLFTAHLFLLLLYHHCALSLALFTYSHVSSTCFNSPSLPNTSISDYNLTGTARFVVFANHCLDYHQTYFLAFVSLIPGSYLLSLLISGSPRTGSLPDGSALKVVWTANFDRPVADAASLQLAPDGNLILWDADGSVVWSSRTSNVGVRSLRINAGSLQLVNSTNATKWESFDSPSDSLVLGQPLLYQKKLVSLNPSAVNAVQGAFSLVMDVSGVALYASLPDPQVYWTWGVFGNTTFSISRSCDREMTAKLVGNSSNLRLLLYQSESSILAATATNSSAFCSVLNASTDRSSSSYQLLLSEEDPQVALSVILRLDNDGNIRVYAYNNSTGWQRSWELFSNACLLPDSCGAYGVCRGTGVCLGCPVGDNGVAVTSIDSGCSASYKSTCLSNSSSSWEMLSISGLDYFGAHYSTSENVTSQDACEQLCARNCSCVAAFYSVESTSCTVLSQLEGSLRSVSNTSTVAFLKFDLRDLSFNNSQSSSNASKRSLLIGLATGISGFAVLIVLLIMNLVSGRRKIASVNHEDMPEDYQVLELTAMSPTRFSFKELERATCGFSEKLGQGGFGVVYKGVLPDGRSVAVKKLEGALQGHKEFLAEVAALGRIHHWHLVQLYGFCAEGSHRLLVYEYLANGSLGRCLFPRFNESPVLTWEQRHDIAVGMAKGLSYLHSECKETIIHLDIKPQNVLLDHNFVAKLADFGLSRFISRDERSVVTTMRGTPGYVAPEWLLDCAITEKSDVYSFGMVLLELVSGRRNQCPMKRSADPEDCYFPARALRMLQEKRELELVDARLAEAFDGEDVKRILRIGLLCVQEDSTKRPCMWKVVQMLQEGCEVPDPPLIQNLHIFLEAHFRMMGSAPSSTKFYLPSSENEDNEQAHGLLGQVDHDSKILEYSQLSAR